MSLKITIDSASELQDQFIAYNRNNYSLDGYRALLDYYDESENALELDVIAICCDWDEMSVSDIITDYSIDISDLDDEDEILEVVMEYLNDRTYAIDLCNGSILFQCF